MIDTDLYLNKVVVSSHTLVHLTVSVWSNSTISGFLQLFLLGFLNINFLGIYDKSNVHGCILKGHLTEVTCIWAPCYEAVTI